MAKKQVRDSAYYEERLKRDYPAIYADLKGGKYLTVADAALAAGLKKPRTRLQEMKNAWSKAGRTEQHDFLKWIRASATPTTSSGGHPSRPLAVDGYIEPWARTRIEQIRTARKIGVRHIRDEMGVPRHDTSLEMALNSGVVKTRIRQELVKKLEIWLAANASV